MSVGVRYADSMQGMKSEETRRDMGDGSSPIVIIEAVVAVVVVVIVIV